MKILPVEGIREADKYTIESEGIASIELMERASEACVEWFVQYADTGKRITIFSGIGNNGGDGLAIARLLAARSYKVRVFLVKYADKLSKDCQINLDNLSVGDVCVTVFDHESELPSLEDDIVMDAMFGSGLNRPIEGFSKKLIQHINLSRNIVVAIDIPSGLFADKCNLDDEGIIQADYTLSFELPKHAFFHPMNDRFVGNWELLPIGLSQEFIQAYRSKYHLLLHGDVLHLLQPRRKFSHKGTYGHALLMSGSYGKMGAAVLAARAALRSGCGLLSAAIPEHGNCIMQTAVPEVMTIPDAAMKFVTQLPSVDLYTAIAFGPGVGVNEDTSKLLKSLIQRTEIPLIIDADGLNILAKNKTWMAFLPKGSILTPHPGEFRRLVGDWDDDYHKIQKQLDLATKFQIFVILKGAHTSIACPDGKLYYNSTGNSGMATAGSGDVLTGILLGLKAQGYSSLSASLIAVYLHGLSGDIAASDLGPDALMSGDIVNGLAKAWMKLYV